MSDADVQMFKNAPLAKDGRDYDSLHVLEEVVNFEEVADLAEDYRVWAVPGMLPGLERGRDSTPKIRDHVPTGRKAPHGSVNTNKAYAPGRTPKFGRQKVRPLGSSLEADLDKRFDL